MKTFRIVISDIHYLEYEIESESEEDAVMQALSGEHDAISDWYGGETEVDSSEEI